MAILNPDHLLAQARTLVQAPVAGPVRQVDLRRAISSSYYALFHFVLTAAADEFIGATFRTSSRYRLVYRSVDHRVLKVLCEEVKKANPGGRLGRYFPVGGFDPKLVTFARIALDLQERRHGADYDPGLRFGAAATRLEIDAAERAIAEFAQAPGDHRKIFLTLLLCPPR